MFCPPLPWHRVAAGWLLPALWLGACPLQAADHFIVLGSGGVPAAQEASIFEVADFWRTELGRRYRPAQTTVLFGAGNQPGRKPFYADVRIQREAEAKPGEVLAFETLEPGRLRRNQPATPANLASALTRHLRAPGQVWLFAHGHGSPEPTLPEFHPDRFRHNRLLLWQAEPTQQQAPTEPAPFTVPELRNRLAAPGRKADFVFLITSCYSGGFHQAIVGDDDRRPVIQRGAAGFTAAHEDLASAGCTTTPDFWQDTYVGLFAGKFAAGNPPGKVRRPALTLTEAHRAAVLALPAWSFELPLATSDYYLERWTEALLSEHPGDQAVWGERRQAAQTAFTAAWKQPATPAPAPWTRHRRWVEDVIARTPGLDQPRRRAALANPVSARQMLAELHQRKQVAAQLLAEAETQTAAAGPAVAAAWHQYFPQLAGASGRPKALLAEHAWEPEAAAAETADPDPLRWPDQLFNRHSHLAATDPARFDALGRWLARRAELRDTWIVQTLAGDLTAANPTVAALTEWRQRTLQHVAADGAALTAETEWANFRRAVIYREVSAAWFALAAIEDTRALADLAELHRLESLTLPAPGRK